MVVDQQEACAHHYLTSHGRGWECADCGIGILSIAVPLPLPLIVEALQAIGRSSSPSQQEADQQEKQRGVE